MLRLLELITNTLNCIIATEKEKRVAAPLPTVKRRGVIENPVVTGVTSDSRKVKQGYLFAAFPGTKQDGRQFIDDAVINGAVAVLVPTGTVVENPSVFVLTADNPRQVFASMAAAFYGSPLERTVAVTGTNGKSSTVHFCRELWQGVGTSAASMGTLGILAPNYVQGGSLTTPDPVTLHQQIAELARVGVTHLALEASSQGMDQYRLDGLEIAAAGFTNLTRDHLDYHGSMENYAAAKFRLFSELVRQDGVAVLNADSDYYDAARQVCKTRGLQVVDFGTQAQDIRLMRRQPMPHGQNLSLEVLGSKYEVELPLVGDFQAWNALCALGLVLSEKPDDAAYKNKMVEGLTKLGSVRGRLELAAQLPNGAAVYVDYAHTPDGLETMLKALRPHTQHQLHVVFGCGGDRDKGKRPMMGEIAQKCADGVIVTDDNPRTENAIDVRADIMKACAGAQEIADRRVAIQTAVNRLQAGDVLVVAGKGHEQGQIVGKTVLPFDDVTEVKLAVQAIAKL